jgi:hypothetical protein
MVLVTLMEDRPQGKPEDLLDLVHQESALTCLMDHNSHLTVVSTFLVCMSGSLPMVVLFHVIDELAFLITYKAHHLFSRPPMQLKMASL